jgi:ATP-binding cassette subfamily F protein 3
VQPTNHLDVTSREVLEDALRHYGGAVLLISHDRYFLSQTATTVLSFDGDGLVSMHQGDYYDYLHSTEKEERRASIVAREVSGSSQRLDHAMELVLPLDARQSSKSARFGGSGVTSGNLFKGVKNAKRYAKK